MMPEGHRRMKWLFRYGQILMKKIIKFNTIKTDFLLCRIIQDYRVENYVQEMRSVSYTHLTLPTTPYV